MVWSNAVRSVPSNEVSAQQMSDRVMTANTNSGVLILATPALYSGTGSSLGWLSIVSGSRMSGYESDR